MVCAVHNLRHSPCSYRVPDSDHAPPPVAPPVVVPALPDVSAAGSVLAVSVAGAVLAVSVAGAELEVSAAGAVLSPVEAALVVG